MKQTWLRWATALLVALFIVGGAFNLRTAKAAAILDVFSDCPNIVLDYSIDNPDEGFVSVNITVSGPNGTLATYSRLPNPVDTITSLASSWAYTPANGSLINVYLDYTIDGGESGSGEAFAKLTYDCSGGEGGGCAVVDGANQDLLTSAHQLYWGADVAKGTGKYIPAGAVVSVLDNKTPSWLKISWACGTYYIRAVDHVPNPAKVTKPFSNGK
jgi:hypothetical protein